MLDTYLVDSRESDELVQIAREARQKGWWHPYSAVLVGAYVGLEAAARSVRAYEQQVIPGLLQSEDYAVAMIRAARWGDTPREIDRRVHVRLARQSLLIQDDPIDLWVVLDEAVLSRPVGGDQVMREVPLHFRHDPGVGPHPRGVHEVDRDVGRGAIVEVETKGFRIDLNRAQWFKSRLSGPNCDNCVEVAFVDEAIAVRDAKNPNGPALIFTAAEWDAFVGGAKDGEFDL
jgi:hypothetical protein